MEQISTKMVTKIADFFRIISDPSRVRLLLLLQEGENCVSDMADALGMTHSAVSHQMNVLRSQHIIGSRRDGKQIYYYMADGPMQELFESLEFRQAVQAVATQ